MNKNHEDEAAPGWDAIDAALARLYPGQDPRHVGYTPSPELGGTGLNGCSAYAADGHWHYVSYGLSELFEPGPEDDPEWSGWGFELTLRVRRGDETQAPGWPFAILQRLATHVNTRRVLLEPGHRIDMGRPATGHPDLPDAPPTGLTVYALLEDPQLGTIGTPHGRVVFLQVVGVSAAEKEEMLQAGTETVLARLAAADPLLVTDPARVV
ncbi:suppressor of fused domain protein [Streptacidiphilus jiangxiensis]|uniref:Suppressor of fused protein (SUFU) n=1 Tax=Streptacidiphilus jiangxiensis TaxID=235985 RepID=A0A1H7RCX3_STRJI|nr:suppressor of fused domain protein [Streptacidiphilus jiangxiensis]SEL57982.1 Suppressor of fused protein (SUFU) [Streptacidiphilus jiangxiensis]